MRRLLILLVLFLISSISHAQATRPNLLAFALSEAPDVAGHLDYRQTIYVYDPQNETVEAIGTGNAMRWSPSGRYLAMLNINTVSIASDLGQFRSFSVYDFETGQTQTHGYSNGDFLVWSPDEDHLLVGGSQSHGLNGSNAWVDFFNPDGSGADPEPHLTFVDGILGSHGGVFGIGWAGIHETGQLLARRQGVSRSDYVLINPVTGEETVIQEPFPVYNKFIEGKFGDTGASKSSDNRYTAVTRVARSWPLDKDFSSYLLIVDMDTGTTHQVTLPVPTGSAIEQMVWGSCHPVFGWVDCYF